MLPTPRNAQPAWFALVLLFALPAAAQDVFINEIHYDNAGADVGEFIEIAGPAATDLSAYSLVLYNGNGGAAYNTVALSGLLPNDGGSGIGAAGFAIAGIQNGSPDGIALAENGTLVQFLSYEGSFTGVGGPADGVTSTDIGVSEASSTEIGTSLQLAGEGAVYSDFTWQASAVSTIDSRNNGQVFVGGSTSVFISEIHYDNTGGDTGEAIEVTGTAGADLSTWSLVLYNGNNGAPYNTTPLSGILPSQSNGFGALSFAISGIQNGSPDGIALENNGELVQFLSYEGSFTAVGGVADGIDSTDIGVAEPGDTPIGQSLQLEGCAVSIDELQWSGPADDNFGQFNPGIELVASADECIVEPPPPPGPDNGIAFINEIHYDNSGSDAGEAIEIAGTAGLDLTGWSLVLYNGNGGTAYNTVALSGQLADQQDGFGALGFAIPGIQNGAPDGVALSNAAGELVQFLSYEGEFTAVGGVADGVASTDIGVSESSSTPVGFSLQVAACNGSNFSWTSPVENTFDAVNTGQSFTDAENCLPDFGGGEEPPAEPVVATIPEIQGSGLESPLVNQPVIVTAVVTGDFQGDAGSSGDIGGFFIQDGGDGDTATSDGLFVFQASLDVDVSVGDSVRITGTVAEFFGNTQLVAESIEPTDPIPLPSPALVSFPLNSVDDLEAFEGMLVEVPQTMTVTDLDDLNRFGEVVLAANGRQFQFTQQNAPDVALNTAYLEEQAQNRLLLDDGFNGTVGSNIPYPAPGLADDNVLRVGDSVTGLVGNLDFGFGSYRLRPIAEPVFTADNPRPETVPDIDGRLRIVSFNVENFFNDLDGRGADTPEELSIQIDKLVEALTRLDADVYGLVELENDSSEGPSSAIAELTAALNAAGGTACGASFDYAAKSVADPTEDEIAVGIIYCGATVASAEGTSLAVLNDTVLTELGLFTRPLFNANRTNRTPIAATFEELATGETFTVSVNHFKSKSPSNCDSVTPNECPAGDGAGAWNAIRTEAASALSAWLATHPTGSDDPDIVILGDLNAYAFETPITTLEAAGYEDLGKRELGTYGYLFDGFSGTLDYAMTSADLSADVMGVAEWHINADESDEFEYADGLANPDSPFRISDHDPLLVGVDLDDTIAPEALSCGTPASGTIQPRDRGVAFTASAVDAQDANPSVTVGEVRCQRRLRFFTIPYSFCRVSTAEDTVTIRLPGGVRNRISWTVTATDDAGNTARRDCAVDVVRGGRRFH